MVVCCPNNKDETRLAIYRFWFDRFFGWIIITKVATMIEPETSNFFGNELDKAKLEIVSYWKDKYEKTRKALEIALKGLDDIIDSGSDGYWTAIKTKEQIKTALEQKDVK